MTEQSLSETQQAVATLANSSVDRICDVLTNTVLGNTPDSLSNVKIFLEELSSRNKFIEFFLRMPYINQSFLTKALTVLDEHELLDLANHDDIDVRVTFANTMTDEIAKLAPDAVEQLSKDKGNENNRHNNECDHIVRKALASSITVGIARVAPDAVVRLSKDKHNEVRHYLANMMTGEIAQVVPEAFDNLWFLDSITKETLQNLAANDPDNGLADYIAARTGDLDRAAKILFGAPVPSGM